MSAAAIVNIGTVVTGRLDRPLLEADAVLMVDGRIAAIGRRADVDLDAADLVIDAGGTTLSPGLIDSHCHVVIGDFTPRQKTVDFLESYVHGGITRCVDFEKIRLMRPLSPGSYG